MSKPKVSPINHRNVALAYDADDENSAIRAALSSEEPVARMFGKEVLRHTDEAIDMSRAADGLPLTVNHTERDPSSTALPIGRVRNIALDSDGKLRGDLVFDTDEESQSVRGKVTRGVATDVSLTYRIDDYDGPTKEGVVIATRWMPMAVSVVTMPADQTVGVGRSFEEADMPEEKTPEAGAASIVEQIKARSSAGFKAGEAAATVRLNDIEQQWAVLARAIPDLAADLEALKDYAREHPEVDGDKFRALALELIGGAGHPLTVQSEEARSAGTYSPPVHQPSQPAAAFVPPPGPAQRGGGATRQSLVMPGADHSDKVSRGVELALLERIGSKVDADEMAGNQFRGWSLLDMQRALLEAGGIDPRGMSSEQIAKASIQGRAISPGTANYQTSDFPAVTANVLTKRVNDAFAAAEVTWNRWCSTIEVPDFKQFDVPRLSQVNSLPVVAENAQYTNLTQVDAREQNTLVKRGGLLSFSWEAMVNDDMAMFLRTADRMGEAAARTVDEGAYSVLTTNANMGDTNPLFDVAHGNTGTDALDFDGVVATRTRMARQTDDNNELLGVIMRFLIVPEELRETANQLAGAEYLPKYERDTSGTATDMAIAGAQMVNTLRSTFEVVSTVRLTDVNDWYAQGAIGQGVEVAFLTGNRNPAIERDSGWDTDAIHYKVRHPSIAYPIDWRGLQRNVVT